MKALIAVLLLTSVSAYAKSIPSIAECNVASRSTVNTGTYNIENTRISGKVALKKVNLLKAKKASVESELDILGVKRYETITKNKLLSSNGVEVNSCEGVYYATVADICTVASEKAVCETFCKIEWRGEDCR